MASESDDDVKSQEGDGEEEKQTPLIWKFAQDDKVGPIHKHLKALDPETELLDAVKEVNPSNGHSLLMWCTLKQRFVLVEWLMAKCKRDAFVFTNAQQLEIYDKFVEKRKERAEREAEKAAEKAERATAGEVDEEPEEEEPEPEIWQEVKNEVGEEVDEQIVRRIGALGVYEGGRDTYGNKNGIGKSLFVNGDMYIGEYRENKRMGTGSYYWASEGNVYVGKWKDNMRWGIGRMLYKDGSRYYGNWENDKRSGSGRYTYPNGDVYDGQWVNDIKEGEGTYVFNSDSSKYQGSWRNGSFTSGKWILSSGVVYYGVFSNGLPEGRGVFIINNGKIKQEGVYVNNQWQCLKVDNVSPSQQSTFLTTIQDRQIQLRFTPEGAAQDKYNGGIASLVQVVNYKPYQQWVIAVESQYAVKVHDVEIRCIDRDYQTGDIRGVRLRLVAKSLDGKRLPLEEVYLQPKMNYLLIVVQSMDSNEQYAVCVRRPNLAVGDLKNPPQLPVALNDGGYSFSGTDIQKITQVTDINFNLDETFPLHSNFLDSSSPESKVYVCPSSTSLSMFVWLYKQKVHADRLKQLQQRVQYYRKETSFTNIDLLRLEDLTSQVKDLPSLTAILMYQKLGVMAPSATVPPVRPPTPVPPAPEPEPLYSEEEVALQKAMYSAEQAKNTKPEKTEDEEEEL